MYMVVFCSPATNKGTNDCYLRYNVMGNAFGNCGHNLTHYLRCTVRLEGSVSLRYIIHTLCILLLLLNSFGVPNYCIMSSVMISTQKLCMSAVAMRFVVNCIVRKENCNSPQSRLGLGSLLAPTLPSMKITT